MTGWTVSQFVLGDKLPEEFILHASNLLYRSSSKILLVYTKNQPDSSIDQGILLLASITSKWPAGKLAMVAQGKTTSQAGKQIIPSSN